MTTNKSRRIIGITLGVSGMALLMLNAIDYLMRWNQINSGIPAIGMMCTVIGAGLIKRIEVDRK